MESDFNYRYGHPYGIIHNDAFPNDDRMDPVYQNNRDGHPALRSVLPDLGGAEARHQEKLKREQKKRSYKIYGSMVFMLVVAVLLAIGLGIFLALYFTGETNETSSVTFTETLTCNADEFDCGHSVCISDAFRCNNIHYDCADDSDEYFCGCVIDPCLNNATCQPVGGYGFNCSKCPDGFHGERCEQEIVDIFVGANETVAVTSPGYPDRLSGDDAAVWIIQTDQDRKILVDFNLTTDYYDYWKVGDGVDIDQSTFLSLRRRTRHIPSLLSNGSAMWISFWFSTSYRTREAFYFAATSVTSTETLTCTADEFDCGHAVCISDAFRCDHHDDCTDDSDESSCGCVIDPCLNNATCQPVGWYGFNCSDCPDGFNGERCEQEIVDILVGGNETVEVTSPGYPQRLSREDGAIWIIQTDPDTKILVDFNDLTTYSYDYWKVGDGVDVDESTFLSWRGRYRHLPNLLSNGRAIWISLSFSSFYGTRSAFSFNVASVQFTETLICSADEFDCGHSVCINSAWRCDHYEDCHDGSDEECGCIYNSCLNNGTCQPFGRNGYICECPVGFGGARCQTEVNIINLAANESAIISKRSYPSNYYANLDIQWIIQTVEDMRILLNFTALDFAPDYIYLDVGNGRNATDYSTWVFGRGGMFGTSLPPDTLSTGNAMWMWLRNDKGETRCVLTLSAQSVQPTDLSK